MLTPTVIKEEILHLLRSQVQCALATLNQHQPCQHLMAYAFSDDTAQVWCASYRDTRKVANIQQSPKVSLLWDNRSGNTSDHTEGLCLSAFAEAEIVSLCQGDAVYQKLLDRNPNLQALLAAPESVTLQFNIQHYVLVQGYDQVSTYEP